MRYQFNYWLNTPDDNKILFASPAAGFYLHRQKESDDIRAFDSIRHPLQDQAKSGGFSHIQEIINLDTNKIVEASYSTDFNAHERFVFERSGVHILPGNNNVRIVEGEYGDIPHLAYRVESPEHWEPEKWQNILDTEHLLFIAMMKQPPHERDYSKLMYSPGDDYGLIYAKNAFLYGEHTFRMRYLKVQHGCTLHLDTSFLVKNFTRYARQD